MCIGDEFCEIKSQLECFLFINQSPMLVKEFMAGLFDRGGKSAAYQQNLLDIFPYPVKMHGFS